MPEGDTIHRTADRLRPALAGQRLLRFDAPRLLGDRPRPGTLIESVEAVGKHLLVHFAGGLTLETHMRMTGSWHIYRAAERWRQPAHLVRARLDVDGWVAVCFVAPVVRTYRRDKPGGPLGTGLDPVGHSAPTCAGPTSPRPTSTPASPASSPTSSPGPRSPRPCSTSGWPAASATSTSPRCSSPAGSTRSRRSRRSTTRRDELIVTASRLLQANLGGGPRVTVPGGLAVYGRQRQPCIRCGTPIRMRRHGRLARSTYWCPTCQPPAQPPTQPPTNRTCVPNPPDGRVRHQVPGFRASGGVFGAGGPRSGTVRRWPAVPAW